MEAETTEAIARISGQMGAMSGGLSSNTRGRSQGGSDNTVTRDTVFMSTQNLSGAQDQFAPPALNAWLTAEGRNISGIYDGWAANMLFGADMVVGDSLLVGGVLAYGRSDITAGTQRAQITSLAVGGYFAQQLRNSVFLDGSLTYGRSENSVGASRFYSSRVGAAFSLSGNFASERFLITPSANLSVNRSEQPSYTGESGPIPGSTSIGTALSVSMRVEPLEPLAMGLMPYISVGLDYLHNASTLSGSSNFTSPRVGLGLGANLGTGYLSVDLDAGQVAKDVRDVGLRATYEFTF